MSPATGDSTEPTTTSTVRSSGQSTAKTAAKKTTAPEKSTTQKKTAAAKKTSAASKTSTASKNVKKRATKRTTSSGPAPKKAQGATSTSSSKKVKKRGRAQELGHEAEVQAGKLAVDARRSALESGFAMLGITDLAIERLRQMQQQMEELRAEMTSRTVVGEFKRLSDRVVSLPNDVLTGGLETAEKAEEQFDHLAARGRNLVERVSHDDAVAELLDQGRATVSRGKSLVTVARKGAKQSASAAQGALTTLESGLIETVNEAIDRVEEVEEEVSSGAKSTAKTTEAAAKRATTTARKQAAATKSQAKGLATSASKTVEAAEEAAEQVASHVGDPDNETKPRTPAQHTSQAQRQDAVKKAEVEEKASQD